MKKLLKYLIASLIIYIPLYPKFPLFRIQNFPVAVRLEDMLILFTFLVWFIVILPDIKKLLTKKVYLFAALFLSIGFISLISAIFITNTVDPQIGLLHWGRRAQYLSIFFIVSTTLKSRSDLIFYLRVILIVLLGMFFYGVGQKYFGLPVITTQNPEYSRGLALNYIEGGHLVSTFAGHYDLASFVVLISPFLYSLFFKSQKISPKILTLFLIVSSYWLLVQAASRISLVSYIGAVSLLLIFINKKKFIPIVLVLSIVFSGLSSNLIMRYMRIFDVALGRISQNISLEVYAQEENVEEVEEVAVEVFEDRSSSIRFNVEWPRALRAIQKSPLLGTGYSSITLATDNGYLRLLGEVGVLGFLSFFAFIGELFTEYILKTFRKKLTLENLLAVSLIAGSAGIFLNMVFIDILEASKFAIMFWILNGLAFASLSKGYEKNK